MKIECGGNSASSNLRKNLKYSYAHQDKLMKCYVITVGWRDYNQ